MGRYGTLDAVALTEENRLSSGRQLGVKLLGALFELGTGRIFARNLWADEVI